ncbi:GMC oxidoreductase [Rufibacter tibetensis]|uniref:Glucose-methanol-choline oxidoreductase C-terminal domain-containing protein n=1 Tax=Rufibacter tibetensis TaxID=512763 RepID=A0A0P0CHU5_9BACT|nr:GMC family oxidoreductase [Rufibacter tibetensis]ALI98882.1 hypothetical protein DC20_07710 [Rufibacter tibetensis]
MILSKEHLLDKQDLLADICIVGGGPAAIAMALQLASKSIKVVIVTGGGWTQTLANKDIYKGEVSPPMSHERPDKMRRRQFGGGTAVWAGRCVPFEPIDYRHRSWVPDSGWPITYKEMVPYYKKACGICQIGAFDFNAHSVFPTKPKEIIPGFDSSDFDSSFLERYSAPINFAKAYKAELERSPTVKVLLDCHALSLHMEEGNGKVSHLSVAAGDARITVTAAKYVLAAGGIETPRLLLASTNDYFPTGIGNQHDNVGRYYNTHITGTYAKVAPDHREKIIFDYERDAQGIFCRRRWGIPEQTQTNKELLNTIFYLSYPHQLTEKESPFSTMLYNAAKYVSQATGLRDFLRKEVQAKGILGSTSHRMYNLGLPARLPSKNSKFWGLFFSAEQTPNRNSRITLSQTSQDALGMPRVNVQIAFTENDVESLVKAHNLFVARFRKKNLGKIEYTEDGFREYLLNRLQHFNSYAHHMGTTRMSDDPNKGVVDRNAKVYGVKNLFIAGSSTFPTGGHANPTVTVVAQALRLADHLTSLKQTASYKKQDSLANIVL